MKISIIRLTIPALSHKKVLRLFMLSNERRKKDERTCMKIRLHKQTTTHTFTNVFLYKNKQNFSEI